MHCGRTLKHPAAANAQLYRADYQLVWLDELFHEVCDDGLAAGGDGGGAAAGGAEGIVDGPKGPDAGLAAAAG